MGSLTKMLRQTGEATHAKALQRSAWLRTYLSAMLALLVQRQPESRCW